MSDGWNVFENRDSEVSKTVLHQYWSIKRETESPSAIPLNDRYEKLVKLDALSIESEELVEKLGRTKEDLLGLAHREALKGNDIYVSMSKWV